MADRSYRCLGVSSFNINNLTGYLANDEAAPAMEVTVAPYGQVTQVLIDPDHELWSAKPDLVVVWTQPEAVIAGFQRFVRGEQVDVDVLLGEVDAYGDLLLRLQGRASTIFVPTWTPPPHVSRSTLHEAQADTGVVNLVMQMNVRLSQKLKDAPGFFVLDAQRWQVAAGAGSYSPKMWYLAKVPFSHALFKEAARDIKSAVRTLYGETRKLIVLDLDNTLWGGIVGDDGWQNLTLGGHNAWGEAYRDFQFGLKALAQRGILLGIVSKNEEAVALQAIENHPEMILRKDDFVGWKINWQTKAENIAALVKELNLGLQSVVFIDDNPVERDNVRQMLPEVLVPEWPTDSLFYPQALAELTCFDTLAVSDEDRERTRLYAVERQRQQALEETGSVEDWLASLDIRVGIEPLDERNLPRVSQLLNKTNQMNLSTRRLSDTELVAWASQPGRRLWALRVADRFGDLGLTGILSIEQDGDRARVVDFVLSCRAMGRKVEETMLAHATEEARKLGLSEVYAVFLPTEKNKPCFDFWMQSGFDYAPEEQTFRWSTGKPYPSVSHITVDYNEVAAPVVEG